MNRCPLEEYFYYLFKASQYKLIKAALCNISASSYFLSVEDYQRREVRMPPIPLPASDTPLLSGI